MRNLLIFVPVLAIATACASAPPATPFGEEHPGPEMSARRPTVLAIPELRTMYADAPAAAENLVSADPAAVRLAIKMMFVRLDVPLTVDDPRQDAYGNNDFQKSHRIGNKPMSDFLDCGVTAMGPRTATNRMYMSLITIVDSVRPNRTRVKSTLSATARDMSGTSNAALHCSSTGALERLLVDSVVAMAQRGS
ncbi:MAG: hypothetical protein ABI120_19385 [Gemmatimonadaceae bacterium]